jgi:hypothetical protein
MQAVKLMSHTRLAGSFRISGALREVVGMPEALSDGVNQKI